MNRPQPQDAVQQQDQGGKVGGGGGGGGGETMRLRLDLNIDIDVQLNIKLLCPRRLLHLHQGAPVPPSRDCLGYRDVDGFSSEPALSPLLWLAPGGIVDRALGTLGFDKLVEGIGSRKSSRQVKVKTIIVSWIVSDEQTWLEFVDRIVLQYTTLITTYRPYLWYPEPNSAMQKTERYKSTVSAKHPHYNPLSHCGKPSSPE
jgi:hypothetical protein